LKTPNLISIFDQIDESVNFLLELADKPEVKNGHLGIVFNGVLRGLLRTYNVRAWEYLRQAIEYGAVPEVSRPTAILAFAEIVREISFILLPFKIILGVNCEKYNFQEIVLNFILLFIVPNGSKKQTVGNLQTRGTSR
jgi:hypothetical protein